MRHFCLDCGNVRELDKHGRCATCGSDAICPGEGLRPVAAPLDWINRAIEQAAQEQEDA